MIATAIHAPVPAGAANSLMVPLHKASCVLKRGVQDGGVPALTSEEIQQVKSLYQVATTVLEHIETDLLDLTKQELSEWLLQLETIANISDTLKLLGEVAMKTPHSAPATRPLQFGRQVGGVFIAFHERLTDVVELARHLASANPVDEDSEAFGAFLVELGDRLVLA